MSALPPPPARGFFASTLFAWLFALALSTRVVYPEVVQMTFFALTFACAWASFSLRTTCLHYVRRFLACREGKTVLLLLLSSAITTGLVSARVGARDSASLWLDWLLLCPCAFVLFGLTALLGQNADKLRYAFRLVATMLGICFFLLLLITLYRGGFLQFLALPSVPVTAHFSIYWDSIYNGLAIVFVPLLVAVCATPGIGRRPHVRSRLFWRYSIMTILLLFVCDALLTERRVVGAMLLVVLVVLSLAVVLRYVDKRYGLLLGAAAVLFGLLLFAYLYHHPQLYPMRFSDCARCNELYLPLWLVDAPRQVAWHETIVVWQQHPWFGIGVHNEETVLTHPHNRFLQILVGLGAVGFGIFLTLLCLAALKSLRAWMNDGSLKNLSLLMVHSVYWTGGLFDLSIWSIWHFCVYASAIVLSLSLDTLARGQKPKELAPRS